jgi:hydroxyacylglutathione hydrolase
VARTLAEGDDVAGFIVLDTPGHSPGHVSYWRESDRVLVCGDVMWGYNPFLLKPGIREPYHWASPDPQRNRASARRLAELEPALVCFGRPCATRPRSHARWRGCLREPRLAPASSRVEIRTWRED